MMVTLHGLYDGIQVHFPVVGLYSPCGTVQLSSYRTQDYKMAHHTYREPQDILTVPSMAVASSIF